MSVTQKPTSRTIRSARQRLLAIVRSVLCAVAALFLAAPAGAATYAYMNDTFNYDTPSGSAQTVTWHTSGAAPACTGFPNGDDDWFDLDFSTATTPANDFTFTFGGVAYTQVRIYSNGMLAFNDASGFWRDYTSTNLPVTAASGQTVTGCADTAPARFMAVYWLDIVAGTANSTSGASIKYELLGTAPNRRMVISWANVKLYNQTARYNFQVALYESPGGSINSNFKFQYTTGSATGSGATVGVQLSTTDYTRYSYNQSFIDPAVGSAILWYPANQSVAKNAEYRFDEASWNGTAGEIKDSSGAGNDGVKVGGISSTANGKICRAGNFTNNNSNTTRDGVSIPITPANVGSIDLWYKSNSSWTQNDALILDATTTAARPFFFMRTSSGTLKFSVSDASGTVLTATSAAQSFAQNTWHHVGISWNLRPGTNQSLIQVFLDGALLTSTRGTTSGTITTLSTLMFGDNRTSGVTPTGSGTAQAVNGILDEVNVYATEINFNQAAADMNATRSGCTSVDHFHIVHGGSAVTCESAAVTIEAHDSAHALISLSGVTMSLSTSTNRGNWSNTTGGSINSITNLGNGAATYVFSNESAVTFGLQDLTVESLTIGATAGSITNTSGAAGTCAAADYTFGSTCNTALSFVAAGFRFVDASGTAIGNHVAGTNAGTYYLQAVRQSNNSSACVSMFPANSSVNINLAYECNNPTTCQGGQTFTFTPGAGAGSAGTIASNANGAVSASSGTYTTRALTFNAASPAPLPGVPFTFNYTDVGRVRLWATYTPSGGTTISGNAQFVVAPSAFAFSGVTAGPIRAGNAFGATVTAVNAAGNATPNFGKETSPESVALAFNRCQPSGAGASNGVLSGAGGPFTFTSGATAVSGLAWSEVGRIDLTATLASGSYLGTGLTATGNTGTSGTLCNGNGNVGAFIPHHFDTQVITHGCGTFSYAGQPFTLKVTARSGLASPTTTVNYDGSAATTPNFSRAITLSDTSGASGTLSPTAAAASSFAAGVATLTTPAWTFASPLTKPATIVLRAVDSDGVSSSGYESAASAPIRSGRLTISNAFGSEKSPLNMSLQTQFWNGAWVTNASDSCTVVPVSAVALSGYTGTLSLASFGATPVSCVASPVTYCDASNNLKVLGGVSYLKLAKPQPNTGSVSVAIDLGASGVDQSCLSTHGGSPAGLPWLRGRFGSCAAATSNAADPSARASFGIYAPETRKVIHMRELF